jgi:hypothetical protein
MTELKTVTNIVIKNYQEFTEEVTVQDITLEHVTIAKEVEAVVQVDDGTVFSIGFSVMRDTPIFEFESPRRMVAKFLLDNFKFSIDIKE